MRESCAKPVIRDTMRPEIAETRWAPLRMKSGFWLHADCVPLLVLTFILAAVGTAIQPAAASGHLLGIFQSGDEGY